VNVIIFEGLHNVKDHQSSRTSGKTTLGVENVGASSGRRTLMCLQLVARESATYS
jgi:hypothetical protein